MSTPSEPSACRGETVAMAVAAATAPIATATAPASAATAPSALADLLLARREARRMLTSHGYVLLLGLLLVVGFPDDGGLGLDNVYRGLDNMLSFGGVATLFAVNLVATSSRRSGAEWMLAAAPLDAERRAGATALGVLLGPAAVATVLTLVLDGTTLGFEALPVTYNGWEYVALPFTWLGAGLLGLAAARWLPWTGAVLAVGVGVIVWVGTGEGLFYGDPDHDHPAGYLTPYVITRNDETGVLSSAATGNLGWHAVFLLGLCLLALTAVLLRHRRPPAVLGLGVLAAVLTVAAGWLQLP